MDLEIPKCKGHVTHQVNVISGHKKIRNIYFCTVEKNVRLRVIYYKVLKKVPASLFKKRPTIMKN